MKKDDTVYLKHILDAISRIERYVQNMEYEKFMDSDLVQDAVIRQTEIVGEATKNLSKEFRQKYSDVEWQDIAGMRDKLIHNYLGVNLDAVWRTVKNDIPSLKNKITKILEKEEKK